ncbi:HBL365Cp [Eremothecium sinecaudum]|uniref:HBL365Cp n=1 Tax=Eremothecium sinecaudum TaxID=45286 RepID=A0A109UWC1_9SACH|nr:HBL365Cp [Eremothecium sinecaudum]AMD18537.1 HBL365Cp [Eremothecium sinecaudum]
MSEYVTKARQLIKQHKYFQLSASWCPDCAYANSIWDRYKVKDKIYEFDIAKESIDKEEETKWRAAFRDATGSANLPTIFIDGQVWGTERELHQHEEAGSLESELKRIELC